MDNRFNSEGYMYVRESQCCEHFEPDNGALVPMKECWCCKWSEFTTDNSNLHSESVGVCCYLGNMLESKSQTINCNE